MDLRILGDLCNHAADGAMSATMRAVALAPDERMRPAIVLRAAFVLTKLAAAAYATSQHHDVERAANLEDPETLRIFHGICRAWSQAPDTAAMDAVTAEVLNAAAVSP